MRSVRIEFADGSTKTVSDYQGKVVLLDFWATYCKPCIEKLPLLQKLQDSHRQEGLVIIAVALDPDVSTAVAWAKANRVTLPIAKFTDELKQTFFGGEEIVAIPQARLIDRTGTLVRSWGPDATIDQIEVAVKDLLSRAVG